MRNYEVVETFAVSFFFFLTISLSLRSRAIYLLLSCSRAIAHFITHRSQLVYRFFYSTFYCCTCFSHCHCRRCVVQSSFNQSELIPSDQTNFSVTKEQRKPQKRVLLLGLIEQLTQVKKEIFGESVGGEEGEKNAKKSLNSDINL